ncbi:MAG TPA: hypothetical protein VH817_06470 [Thermoleophilaceae bacterium]
MSSQDPAVRRYRLARLEDVALASPPNGTEPAEAKVVGRIDMRPDAHLSAERDRRVG